MVLFMKKILMQASDDERISTYEWPYEKFIIKNIRYKNLDQQLEKDKWTDVLVKNELPSGLSKQALIFSCKVQMIKNPTLFVNHNTIE